MSCIVEIPPTGSGRAVMGGVGVVETQPTTTVTCNADLLAPVALDAYVAEAKAKGRRWLAENLEQALKNIGEIASHIRPELVERQAGRATSFRTEKVHNDPVAFQANLAIVQLTLGRPEAKQENGTRVTVPIQIVMGGGKVVDIKTPPVKVSMESAA